MNKHFRLLIASGICISAMVLNSCGSEEVTPSEDPGTKPPIVKPIDPDKNQGIITIGGEVFVIPSPIQTADLLASSNATFNSDILNPTDNAATYTTTFQKALNMGIYGADLGYLTVYKINDKSTVYLKAVRGLANDIGLGNAFNEVLADKINESMEDEGKMLQLVSEAYKTADDYLKENKKDDVAALVIVGGWLESIYFACNVAAETNDPNVVERIADQKSVLRTIIKMLKQYRDDEEYDDLAVELEDLRTIFDGVTFEYEFVDPVTNEAEKKTTIKSKHNVSISDDQVKQISAKINEIRNEITG
ncbi:MAG: hypothetical protein ACI8Q1_000326 [Parvicella sp.]|jgi:hypothetical protein